MKENSELHSKSILTTKEAAQFLRVGVQTIKNYIYQGKIKSFKTPGGHHRILRSDLLSQMKELLASETNPESLYQAFTETIKAFLRALSQKDLFTRGHSERVASYSLSVTNKLGLSESEKKTLELAALLHDIGKINISARILSKPGKLTEEEFSVIKRHPELGAEMVKDVEFLKDARPFIRHHHERTDGAGYPDRLKGNQIPLGARIIFVCETYDMLTSNLAYRQAFSPQKALTELRRVSGRQLDKDIVEAFISSLKSKK